MVIIQIVGLANGKWSPFDGTYIISYNPAAIDGTGYAAGELTVTQNINRAKRFPSAVEAMEYWQQSFGFRPDGKPNRPLTAWTVDIRHATDA